MQFLQSLSLSKISPKYLAGLFICHNELAKQMCEDIKNTPNDSISYKKESLENGNLKVSLFLYKDTFLVRKMDYWFKQNAKTVSQIHFYIIENGVVTRETFANDENCYINHYDLDGRVLMRLYEKATILEVYEYDDNGILIKMNYVVNGKLKRIFNFKFNECNETFHIIETDEYGRKIMSYQNVPKSNYMRPEQLTTEIDE